MASENGEGHIDGLDDSEELTDDDVVTLVDDEGIEYVFVILAISVLDDVEYAMLSPLEQVQDAEDPELELFLFTYGQDENGFAVFGEIPDEKFEEVQAHFATQIDMEGVGLSEVEPGEA